MDEEVYDPIEELVSGRLHPLIEACRNNDYDKLLGLMKKFRKNHKPLTMCNMAGWQAIHYSAELTDTRCLKVLLNEDCNLAQRLTRDGTSPLAVAAGLANLEVVEALLPFLDYEDVFNKNVHGLNALYYAVLSDCARGTSIAKMLIAKCDRDRDSNLGCSSHYDALPYRVIKNKNIGVLKSLLNAGLDPAFNHHDLGIFSDGSYGSYSATSLPTSLVAYCVVESWLEGLQVIMCAHKEQQLQSRGDQSFWTLFNTTIHNSSALQILCEKGDTQCLTWMIENGFQFQYTKDLWLVETLPFHGRSHVLSSFPALSYALSGSIWSKQEFIKQLLSMQSCEDLLKSYGNAITRYLRQTEHYTFSRDLMQYSHPVCAAANAILKCCAEHDIGDSVQMLLDSNFTFNIDRLVFTGHTLVLQDPVTILLNECSELEKTYEIIKELLKRTSFLSITANTVIEAFRISSISAGSGDLIFPHLEMLKFISKRSAEDKRKVHQELCVTHNSVELEKTLGNSTCSDTMNGWFRSAQLLLKGFKASLKCTCSVQKLQRHCFVPIAWLFVTDMERQSLFNSMDSVSSGYCVQKLWKQEPVSSLQALSRATIRKQLGFSRLLFEPVPRVLTFAMDILADSWETSVIDQLPVSSILKDFLRFKPELQQFYNYTHVQKKQTLV